MEGWIKIHRKIMESEIWVKKPASWFKIWEFILLTVNHEDNKHYKKGQNFFNFSELARNKTIGADITINSIEHCLSWLKSAEQIAEHRTTRGVIVTVLNYDKYQQEAEIAAESKRNRSGTINKNDKNDKNILLTTNVSNMTTGSSEKTRVIKKNPSVDLIIQSFHEYAGHGPLDRSPRNIAYTWVRQTTRLIEDIKPYKELAFDDIIRRSFAWYEKENHDVKAKYLNTVRKNVAEILYLRTREKYMPKKEVKPQ